jgi:hypothetical protein
MGRPDCLSSTSRLCCASGPPSEGIPDKGSLVHFAGDSDAGLAEDVGDLCVAKARGVVFEGQMIPLLVDAEFSQAIGVGERPEAAELCEAERILQLVGDFEECHARNYSSSNAILWPFGV